MKRKKILLNLFTIIFSIAVGLKTLSSGVFADSITAYDNYSITNTYGMVEINGTWRRQTTTIINFSNPVNGNMELYFNAQGPSSSGSVSTVIDNYHIYVYGAKVSFENTDVSDTGDKFWIRVNGGAEVTIISQNTKAYNDNSTGAAYAFINSNPNDFGGSLNTNYDSCIVSSSGGGSNTDYSDYLETLIIYSTRMSAYIETISNYDSAILDQLADIDQDGNYVSKLDTIIELIQDDSGTSELDTTSDTFESQINTIESTESSFQADFDTNFDNLDTSGFNVLTLFSTTVIWFSEQLDHIYDASGDLKITFTLPLLLGIALFFIGRKQYISTAHMSEWENSRRPNFTQSANNRHEKPQDISELRRKLFGE